MTSMDAQAGASRILVVEDEFLVAQHITMMLEDLGYEVVGPVPTIPEATAAIADERVDAVLLDANLRGTSSAPVAAELAARRMPYVVVTGYGGFDLATAALQGAPRLQKPFTPAQLAAILATTMAKH